MQRHDSPLNLEPPHLSMLIQPLPFVRKNMLLSLFQEISLTSNLNCSSALERCVLASMNVTTSSLLPTAMVCPSGLQQILMFSPGNPDTISKILLAYNPPEVYLVIKERLELLPRVHSLRSSSVGPTRSPAHSSMQHSLGWAALPPLCLCWVSYHRQLTQLLHSYLADGGAKAKMKLLLVVVLSRLVVSDSLQPHGLQPA